MAVQSSGALKASIAADLADNNAGNISAFDVRHNMEDIVDSMVPLARSGINLDNPFFGSVQVGLTGAGTGGILKVTSGVQFPDGNLQTTFFPGLDGIEHSGLAGLTTGDPHTQYVHINGSRSITGNMGLQGYVNYSGESQKGFRFSNHGVDNTIRFGSGNPDVSGTKLMFDKDSSTIDSFKGVAKAWLNFTAASGAGNSGVAVVDSYNIHTVQRTGAGKFKIFFPSGLFSNNNYVAIGTSNGRGDNDSSEDFDLNQVGVVARSGDDHPTLRHCSFLIKNTSNAYVNAAVNNLVVYGEGAGATFSGCPTSPTVTDDIGPT